MTSLLRLRAKEPITYLSEVLVCRDYFQFVHVLLGDSCLVQSLTPVCQALYFLLTAALSGAVVPPM